MSVTYELRFTARGNTIPRNVHVLLGELSNADEIDIHSLSSPEVYPLKFKFRFKNWQELAEKKYLETYEFKSAIPAFKPSLKEIENNVRRQIFEAAESEFVASKLTVETTIESKIIIFRSEYENTMTESQAQQVGVYLQDYIKLLFNDLVNSYQVHPISILIE